jgi:RNA polymerase sigma-70 factor (TIGR02943 family)
MTVHQPVAGKPGPAAAMWLDEHGDLLYSYALARLRNSEAAEDLVQDTLVAAMEGHARFAGQSTVRTWLVGIMRNKLLEHYRQRKVEPGTLDIDGELPASIVDGEFTHKGRWKDEPKKWGGELASQAEEDDFRNVLRLCLAKLPARTAEAFLLAECDDMPVTALQRALGISSANHVYVLLHRARAALRQCLERNWFGGSGGKR